MYCTLRNLFRLFKHLFCLHLFLKILNIGTFCFYSGDCSAVFVSFLDVTVVCIVTFLIFFSFVHCHSCLHLLQ